MEHLILILYLAILASDILDARADAKKHATGKTLHFTELISKALVITYGAIFMYLAIEGMLCWVHALLLLIGIWGFNRLSVFNISWNISYSKDKYITDVGTTDFLDKILSKISPRARLVVYGLSAFIAWCLLGILEYLML